MVNTGIAVINKEKGYTSHDVAAAVKKILRHKTGHTGTLDPQAEGVLPVCIGRGTKLAGLLTADDKTYTAEVVLGITTDTYDTTGCVLTRQPVVFDLKRIESCISSFKGEQPQQPPMFSAIKMNGKKLYELARAGQTVERSSRLITVNEIKIINADPPANTFTLQVSCSKGTYIRSLCHDIGAMLGCGAAMGALIRTRSGIFNIEDAVTLNVFEQNPYEYIWPVEKALPYPRAYTQDPEEKRALNGNPLPLSMLGLTRSESDKYWVYSGERLIGLYKRDNNKLMPEAMMI